MRNKIEMLMLVGWLAGCAHVGGKPAAARADEWSGRQLAYAAMACWFGPVWQDALGDPDVLTSAHGEETCHRVVSQVWRGQDDKGDYARLRALESNALGELSDEIDARAKRAGDGDRRDLVVLVRATAAAQRENMWARRAADKIKLDIEGARANPDADLTSDELAALEPFRSASALHALLALRAGALTADAHAIGILCAMDRIELGLGLPRRFEVAAAAPALGALFGVAPPALASNTLEVAPHVWIDYLASAARAAGHGLPPEAVGGEQRDRLAWAGVLDGLADRLIAADVTRAPLRAVVEGTERRLRAEAVGNRNWFASKHEPATSTATAP
jgi:hypothetical protein